MGKIIDNNLKKMLFNIFFVKNFLAYDLYWLYEPANAAYGEGF